MKQTVARIVLLQGSKKNQCNKTHQKQYHHERVENRKPMNWMLEELVIQVSVKTRVKFFCCLFELYVKGKFQLNTFLHLFQRLGVTGEIHLHDLVFVVGDDEISRGVYIWVQVGDLTVIQFGHVIEAFQIIFLLQAEFISCRKHLTNHSPNWQIVKVHLIKPTMLNSFREVLRLFQGQWFGGALLRLIRLGQKHNIVTRVTKRVAS
mmetsp:Transcript_19104/g.53208  ORF Transcript_19104/g.53208 Transcript_19104/m.53208 type:complete len:206 (-) Transcript_19104:312-929(-)